MHNLQWEAQLFRYGNTVGMLTARFAKGIHAPTHIKSLRDKCGILNNSAGEIKPQNNHLNAVDVPLILAYNSVKYLGIHIDRTPESIYNLNYPLFILKFLVKERDGISFSLTVS